MRLPQPQQIVVQRVPGDLVERGERLVEQQQVGFGDEGAGDRDAHPHAARQLARIGLSRTRRDPTARSASATRSRSALPTRPAMRNGSSTLRATVLHGIRVGS